MNLFATLGKIPAAKALLQQGLVVGFGLYKLFQPEIDELMKVFLSHVNTGVKPETAAQVAVVHMYEGAWTREEEEAANRRMD